MSLWLCLRFHQLPLACLERGEEQAVVVLQKQRVLRTNDCAAALGVREGMGAATVRALAGSEPLQLLERDRGAEQRALQQLCCWAYSISPTLYSWREDCLQLEIGGCLTLFRGLQPLLAAVTAGIHQRGFQALRGLAPTPRAAWLLSFGDSVLAEDCGRALPERLAPLSLALLDEFGGTVDSLRRAGLHTLGDVLALPPTALARRCGREFSQLLAQVLGQQQDLQPEYQPPTTFSDQYWFGYEVKANDELLPAMQQLLQALCRFLRNTQLQAVAINWQLIGVDRSLRTLCVRSSSCHSDWQQWLALTRIHLEQLQLATGIEAVVLSCEQLAAGELANIDLFNPRQQGEPLARLLDRLRSRLGLQAVEQLGCRDENLPEYAVYHGPGEPDTAAPAVAPCRQRPFWLLPEPRALARRNRQLQWQGPLQLVYGPERIEDNWWQAPVSRDYFIARGEAGEHYWVFRDRLGQGWYLHGIFA